MKNYKTVKTALSVFLTLIIISSTFTIAFAAETLAVKNVNTWPTLSYKTDQEFLYYGQKVSDVLIINDDEVVLNAAGEQVAGHFEFIDSNEIPDDANDAMRANIKFVPDDESTYTGFQRKRCPNVTFKVVPTAPVLINDAPTATSVDSGSTLSASTISGGQVVNPYNPDDADVVNAVWYWTNPNEVVYESGEYEAYCYIHTAYEQITKMIYVEVESSVKATTITELPVMEDFEYATGITFGDIELIGGKAVEYGTDTEVAGTFSVKNPNGMFRNVGAYNIPVVFTPDDTESYTASECTVTVNVTKANYKFVDENGEATVPEITLPYGANFNPGAKLGVLLKSMIKDLNSFSDVDLPQISFPGHENGEIAPVGTNTYNVRVRPYNSNTSSYNVTDLQFVLTIEPVAVEMKLSMSIDEEQTININKVNSNDPYPQGTFDIYVDGALYMEDVKGSFPFDPGKSGNYEIKLVYNPVENDPCVVEEKTTTWIETYHRNLTRGNLVMGGTPTVMYGKEVTLTANMLPENFGGWKITDANGNEVTLEGAVMEGRDITFTMPDFDITVEAIDNSADSDTSGDIDNIFGDLGDLTEGDSDNAIVNIFNNIIALFKRIITTITEFFRSIGDHT